MMSFDRLRNLFLILSLAVGVLSAGCEAVFPMIEATPTASPSAVPTSTLTPTPPEGAQATPEGPVTLTLWLPPEFDPGAGTEAGDLLQARLDEFTSRRPTARIQVRIKAVEGPGGMLEALTSASAAAPLAMPDIVALPRPLLETAAIKGLLHPIDDLSALMESPDWYGYAQRLARLQESAFGLPFAADALVMIYRTTTLAEPPETFSTTLTTPGPLAFPAADPQALFTLAMYQAAGGTVLDEQGRPVIVAQNLAEVLEFFQQAAEMDIMPFWLTQYQTDTQVWEAFQNDQAVMAVTWMSRYLKNMQADIAAAQLPTPDGEPYTLATGWVWALAGANPEHQALSVELAEFLAESTFLARWTAELGYLPPRPSALASWRSASLQSLAGRVETAAHLIPSADALATIAQPLEVATVEVLKLQVEPFEAALTAAEGFAQP